MEKMFGICFLKVPQRIPNFKLGQKGGGKGDGNEAGTQIPFNCCPFVFHHLPAPQQNPLSSTRAKGWGDPTGINKSGVFSLHVILVEQQVLSPSAPDPLCSGTCLQLCSAAVCPAAPVEFGFSSGWQIVVSAALKTLGALVRNFVKIDRIFRHLQPDSIAAGCVTALGLSSCCRWVTEIILIHYNRLGEPRGEEEPGLRRMRMAPRNPPW